MTGSALDAHVVVERRGFRLDAVVQALLGRDRGGHGSERRGQVDAARSPRGPGATRQRTRAPGRADAGRPGRALHVTPSQRGVVLLGQEPRLFPHLTAHGNVAFGLQVHGCHATAADARADEWLSRVGLDGSRRPAPRAAVGRPAAARRARSGARDRAGRAPPRRAAHVARPRDRRRHPRDAARAARGDRARRRSSRRTTRSTPCRSRTGSSSSRTGGSRSPGRCARFSHRRRHGSSPRWQGSTVSSARRAMGRWTRDGLGFAGIRRRRSHRRGLPPTAVHFETRRTRARRVDRARRAARADARRGASAHRRPRRRDRRHRRPRRALGLAPGLTVRLRVDPAEVRLSAAP